MSGAAGGEPKGSELVDNSSEGPEHIGVVGEGPEHVGNVDEGLKHVGNVGEGPVYEMKSSSTTLGEMSKVNK